MSPLKWGLDSFSCPLFVARVPAISSDCVLVFGGFAFYIDRAEWKPSKRVPQPLSHNKFNFKCVENVNTCKCESVYVSR